MSQSDKIIEQIRSELEQNTIPWNKPWVVNEIGVVSHATGKPYSLRNRMLLKYGGEYATFKQIKDNGGRIVKGEHGNIVFFSKTVVVKDEETDEVVKTYPVRKSYFVFRVGSQTENIETKYSHLWERGGLPQDESEIMSIIDSYISRANIKLLSGGDRAFYCGGNNTIQVPGIKAFTNKSEYFHTLFHELVHSTMKQLNRESGAFWSSSYAREELVADIGASLCIGNVGLDTNECISNSSAYISCWKSRLRDFSSTDFDKCVSAAQKAVDLIFNNTRQGEKDENI